MSNLDEYEPRSRTKRIAGGMLRFAGTSQQREQRSTFRYILTARISHPEKVLVHVRLATPIELNQHGNHCEERPLANESIQQFSVQEQHGFHLMKLMLSTSLAWLDPHITRSVGRISLHRLL